MKNKWKRSAGQRRCERGNAEENRRGMNNYKDKEEGKGIAYAGIAF